MSPFTDGYVAAMRESLSPEHRDAPLHPETLAAILKDCAAQEYGAVFKPGAASEAGAMFWKLRNSDPTFSAFPPLTPYLDDAGKVRLREAGQ